MTDVLLFTGAAILFMLLDYGLHAAANAQNRHAYRTGYRAGWADALGKPDPDPGDEDEENMETAPMPSNVVSLGKAA